MLDPQLANKVVLVTGANHGIGAATARAFAAQGAKVFITYYRAPSRFTEAEQDQARRDGIGGPELYEAMQQQPGKVVADQIRAQGGIAVAREANLADAANIPRLFDWCEQELGPVNILVNNHTHCVLETFDPGLVTQDGFGIHLASAEVIDAHFAINSRAFALLMVEYLKRHIRRGADWGRIVNVSTDAADAHTANVSYAASKHAIESYSRSAAAEIGKYGITVNVVAPGPTDTGYLRPERITQESQRSPFGRVGKPEDIADVIVLLASQQAHWLTGQLLYVGGGAKMHL